MSSTLPVIRNRIIQVLGIGIVIPNADIDSIAAAALTSVKWLRNGRWATDQFAGLNAIIHRPGAATAADFIRYAADLNKTTGALAPDANWADTTLGTESVNLIYYGIHPQMIDDAINRALEDLYFRNEVALSMFDDGDMQTSVTSSYTGASGATLSKVTTARRTPFGIRSLRVQSDSANDYAQSGTLAGLQGSEVFIWAIASVDVGGDAVLIPYDVTNSANINTDAQHSEEAPQYMWWQGLIPATCKEFAVRLNGEGASDDIYWNQLGGYRLNDNRIFLPSTFDERLKVEALTVAEFRAGSNTGIADALSIKPTEIPKEEYDFLFSPVQANPYAVQFHNDNWGGYKGKPIFIQGRRPYSDMGALTTEASTTEAPLDLVVAKAITELLEPLDMRARVPNGDKYYGEAMERLSKEDAIRASEGPARRHPDFHMARAGN